MDPAITSDRTHTHSSFLVDRPSDETDDLLEQVLSNFFRGRTLDVSSSAFLSAALANADFRIDACTHSFIFLAWHSLIAILLVAIMDYG